MSTQTEAARGKTVKGSGARINGNKIGAVIVQAVSWLTTFWCVEWIMQPAELPIIIGVSLVAELLLVLMKRCLFNDDKGDDTIGWVGFIIDGVINAGGILPRAGRLLTFPPIALMLGVFGIDAAADTPNKIGAFILALIGGALLSVLPHRLWRAGDD
jgi:hypothetical protein